MKRRIYMVAFAMLFIFLHAFTVSAVELNENITINEQTFENNDGSIIAENISDDFICEEDMDLLETDNDSQFNGAEYDESDESPTEGVYFGEEPENDEIINIDDISISVLDNCTTKQNCTDSISQELIESPDDRNLIDGIDLYPIANSSVSSAQSISVNGFHTGALADSSSANWYKFSLANAGYISLEFMHDLVASGTWKVCLYDANIEEMTSYSYTASQTKYSHGNIGVPAGTYYIKVSRVNDFSSANYQIKINYMRSDIWESEFNDDYATADSINTNVTYYGSLCSTNDADWYKFTVSNAGYISLGFMHDLVASGTWKATLYDTNIVELSSYSYTASQTTYSHGNIGVPAGTYYIKIGRINDSSDVNYQIKINYMESTAWETEFNDDYTTADSITMNTVYSGSLRSTNDIDWYKFTVSDAGYISLGFMHDLVASGTWKASLYDASIVELSSYSYTASQTSYNHGNIGVPAGTYYIKIGRINDSSDVNYQIKINYMKSTTWETEINDDYTTADSITTNTAYFGSLCSVNDTDWYRFSIQTKGLYTLHFNHGQASAGTWKLFLYDSSMSEKITCSIYEDELTYNTNINLSVGIYYIKIRRINDFSDINYSIRIDDHVHNYKDKITKATTSSNGKIVKQCSCGATQNTTTIYYPKTIRLSSISYTYNGKPQTPTVTVIGSDGKTISSSYYTVKYANGRKKVGLYKVFIEFKGNYSGTATLTFKINPKGTNIVRLTRKSKGFKIKWKKQKVQVTGYQIQYSTNKRFSGKTTKTIQKNSNTSAIIKNLKARKSYYVRIRTYKTVSGKKYYSSWSTVKTVKPKR